MQSTFLALYCNFMWHRQLIIKKSVYKLSAFIRTNSSKKEKSLTYCFAKDQNRRGIVAVDGVVIIYGKHLQITVCHMVVSPLNASAPLK